MSKKHRNKSKKQRMNNTRAPSMRDTFQSALRSEAAGAAYGCDLGASYHVNLNSRPLQKALLENVALYENTWEAHKIINIPVFDMLRNGWEYQGLTPEQTQQLEANLQKLQLLNRIKEALRLERLLGGAVIFMGVADGAPNPETPLQAQNVPIGGLKFLNVIPRDKVADVSLNIDPLSAHYGQPESYLINGQPVHRSRLIIFDGDPLTQSRDNSYSINPPSDGFGYSVLTPIYYDILRAIGTRQAAFQLVNKSGTFIVSTDIGSTGSSASDAIISQIEQVMQQISTYKAAIINNDGDTPITIATLSPNFASVPELVEKYLQILSAASDVPATRFLGQAPGGLNATGESDLENYYGRIASEQEIILKPKLNKVLSVLTRSCFGETAPDNIDITFKPLWTASDSEQATRDATVANKYTALVTSGILTGNEAALGLHAEEAIPEINTESSLTEPEADVNTEDQIKQLQAMANPL